MVGISIMRESVFVAATAALVAGHFEMTVLGGFHLMRGVAIDTDRATFIALGQKLSMHTLVVDLLDLDVAFAASLGHIGRIDRRIAVDSPLDVVHPVAIVA